MCVLKCVMCVGVWEVLLSVPSKLCGCVCRFVCALMLCFHPHICGVPCCVAAQASTQLLLCLSVCCVLVARCVCLLCLSAVCCCCGGQVAEVFTGTPGKYVPLENTIKDFKGVLDVSERVLLPARTH